MTTTEATPDDDPDRLAKVLVRAMWRPAWGESRDWAYLTEEMQDWFRAGAAAVAEAMREER